jgi:tripartite-type tricarboxylate transporter receptor subunit TctC
VPFQGGGPAQTALMGGHIDLFCHLSTTGLAPVKAGSIKGFAVTSGERLADLPDLPTMKEAGHPGFEIVLWNALYAPAGTPVPVAEKLNGALRAALADADVQKRFAEFGTQVFPAEQQTPDFAHKHLIGEIERVSGVIKAAGIEPQD